MYFTAAPPRNYPAASPAGAAQMNPVDKSGRKVMACRWLELCRFVRELPDPTRLGVTARWRGDGAPAVPPPPAEPLQDEAASQAWNQTQHNEILLYFARKKKTFEWKKSHFSCVNRVPPNAALFGLSGKNNCQSISAKLNHKLYCSGCIVHVH